MPELIAEACRSNWLQIAVQPNISLSPPFSSLKPQLPTASQKEGQYSAVEKEKNQFTPMYAILTFSPIVQISLVLNHVK